jgi:hypothetical protein
MSMKNSNDTIENRTRDLPACSQCFNQLRHLVLRVLGLEHEENGATL